MRKAALVVLCALALLIWQAPARWVADLVNARAAGFVRATDARGSIWDGEMRLWLRTSAEGSWVPWQAMRWRVDGLALLQGRLAIASDFGQFELSRAGVKVRELQVFLPAAVVLRLVPSSLGRMAWRGDMHVDVVAWQCAWTPAGECHGDARLLWKHVSSPLFRRVPVDQASLSLQGRGREVLVRLESVGPLTLAVEGSHAPGQLHLTGVVHGPADLLDGLQKVASDIVQPGAGPGERRIVVHRGSVHNE